MSNRIRSWILVGAVAMLAITLLACIKVGEKEPEVTPVPPTPTPVPPTLTPVPPTPTPVPEAKPEIVGVSLCRGLTDDERPFAETNTYSELDPFVISIQVTNMRSEDVVSARWYQEDTPIGLTERDNVIGNTYIGLSLEPQDKWVPGNYKVEVSLDGDVAESRDFAVIGIAKFPAPGKGDGGDEAGEQKIYQNTTLGFSMEYPGSWLVEEENSAVQFSHPRDVAKALVMVNADPGDTSEQEAEAVYDVLSQNLPNVQKNASKEQDQGWHGIVFGYNKNGTDIVGILLSKVTGSRGYSIVLLAVQKEWDVAVPVFERMWASFEIEGDTDGGGGDGADEVLIVGVVVDSDTGRGIPNALFVILKEGVSVEEFVDSGNDKSLMYDAAQSGSDGTFKMNVPVKQETTYAVFAVAKGYKPVIDEMSVPQSASTPWKIKVSMQKE